MSSAAVFISKSSSTRKEPESIDIQKSSRDWLQLALAWLPVGVEDKDILCSAIASGCDLGQEFWVSRIRGDVSIVEKEGINVSLVQSGAANRQIVQ